MHTRSITTILHSIIIADALASPLDNLSPEHITNVFGDITDYCDPAPSLKNKLHTWKKPASYTAISQYSIILSAINIHNVTYNHNDMLDFLSLLGDSERILRHPFGFLHSNTSSYDAPTAELMICLPSLFFLQKPSFKSAISFITAHNKNAATFVASLFMYFLLEEIINRKQPEFHRLINETLSITRDCVLNNTAFIFENGINPTYIEKATEDFYNLMILLPFDASEQHFTQYCVPFANKWSKNIFTRLTVNHPFTMLPLALYCMYTCTDVSTLLFSVVHKGGKISVLTPLTAILASSLYGYEAIPQHLMNGIINKKRITHLLESLVSKNISTSYLKEFFQNEEKLTQKENEERESRLKHVKLKGPAKKSANDKYDDLSRHVVESWTKADKAKWKKERKKHKNL